MHAYLQVGVAVERDLDHVNMGHLAEYFLGKEFGQAGVGADTKEALPLHPLDEDLKDELNRIQLRRAGGEVLDEDIHWWSAGVWLVVPKEVFQHGSLCVEVAGPVVEDEDVAAVEVPGLERQKDEGGVGCGGIGLLEDGYEERRLVGIQSHYRVDVVSISEIPRHHDAGTLARERIGPGLALVEIGAVQMLLVSELEAPRILDGRHEQDEVEVSDDVLGLELIDGNQVRHAEFAAVIEPMREPIGYQRLRHHRPMVQV